MPYSASFIWDGEGPYVKLTFESLKTSFEDFRGDFDVKFSVEQHGSCSSCQSYVFSFKSLCFAISAAYTRLLKEFGVIGFVESTWFYDFDIYKLLVIKSYALDMITEVQTFIRNKSDDNECRIGNFQTELEILLKDLG